MIPYYPIVIIFLLSGLVFVPGKLLDDPLKLAQFTLGAIGLSALFASIAFSDTSIRKPRTRKLVSFGLACGIVTTVLFVVVDDAGAFRHARFNWFELYLYGGPLLVTAWNGWRMWRIIESTEGNASRPA